MEASALPRQGWRHGFGLLFAAVAVVQITTDRR
jgi:hypothetical protein